MTYRLFFLCFCCVFLSFTITKDDAKRKEIAKKQIATLKNGVLLVRLYDKSKSISLLKEKGMIRRAEAVRIKQRKKNKDIIDAFKKYTFSKVYFFYAKESNFLLNKEYKKVSLFTSLDEMDKKVVLDSNFLVADIGYLEKEEHKVSDTSFTNRKKGITKVKRYKGSSVDNTRLRCLFLRGNNLKQLKSPFPFYVRYHPSPLHQLTNEEAVEKMNIQLEKFYTKVIK